MRFFFKTKKLAALYYDDKGAHEYPDGVVDAFVEVMDMIESAPDERDLYELKSLHFEQLKRQKGMRSLRLNDQYRLSVRIEVDAEGRYCLIVSISKHYR